MTRLPPHRPPFIGTRTFGGCARAAAMSGCFRHVFALRRRIVGVTSARHPLNLRAMRARCEDSWNICTLQSPSSGIPPATRDGAQNRLPLAPTPRCGGSVRAQIARTNGSRQSAPGRRVSVEVVRYVSVRSQRFPLPANFSPSCHPDVVAEWRLLNGRLNPYTVKPKSQKKAWWQCSSCGAVWRATVADRTAGKTQCARCSYEERIALRDRPQPGGSLAELFPNLVAGMAPHPQRPPARGTHTGQRHPGMVGMCARSCVVCASVRQNRHRQDRMSRMPRPARRRILACRPASGPRRSVAPHP